MDALTDLCDVYRSESQIGLVLGAGVTKAAGVPLYRELARIVVKRAAKERLLDRSQAAVEYLLNRCDDVGPEEMMQFVRVSIQDETAFQRLMEWGLYEKNKVRRDLKARRVSDPVYTRNSTLNAVISFCAAPKGSPLAPLPQRRFETNHKVGAILTTNYDNLVEGAFGTKYKRERMLKPVPSAKARESLEEKRIIPVYHIHGYVSYLKTGRQRIVVHDLVAAEEDYFRTFYNLLGFANSVGMSFLRRFSCLFLGSAMQDANLRRFLYQARRERILATRIYPHFAILIDKDQQPGYKEYKEAVLGSYGVKVIWAKVADIPDIMKRVYVSADGVTADHWKAVWTGKLPR